MARLQRLLIDQPLGGETVALDGPQAHRLRTVLRMRVGGALRLFNAKDGEWDAELTTLGKRGAEARLIRRRRAPAPEPGPTLLFAPLKGGRTELIVEKATELGAAAIQPVRFRRGVVDSVNPERLRAVAIEATEQCERLSPPMIAPMSDFATILADWPPRNRIFACVERGDAPPLGPAGAGEGLLIGPEGGLAPEERDRLAAAPFIAYASLGPRILRAETAALAALAAAAALSGAWAARPPGED